jgi:hypothetical protein
MRRLHALILMLAALSLIAAGCGSGNSGGGNSGGGSGGGTPSTKDQAIQKCKDEAQKISDPNARDAALKACAGDRSGAASALKQQCLDQAQQLPAGSARDQAIAGCDKIKG